MPVIDWDDVGDRFYESGLDRGVLYLSNGTAVPWNGLISVSEKLDTETKSVFYEGVKINELVSLGAFTATMKAVTYPNEFVEIEGLAEVQRGAFFAEQQPQTFGLCYRTKIGNDVASDSVGYKIHILYNVIAVPQDKNYATITNQPSLVEFEWDIFAIPEEIEGFRPTAHFVLDSRTIDPWLLEDLEKVLYGNHAVDASLIPMADLVEKINNWFRVKITDNGDGTWTATSKRNGFITEEEDGYFEIEKVNAIYLSTTQYQISDTKHEDDVPQIAVYDKGNGTFVLSTEHDALFTMLGDGEFVVDDIPGVYLDADTYEIESTHNEA